MTIFTALAECEHHSFGLENREGRLLQVVFAAQPTFEDQLNAPELRGLKQRLLMWARLDTLDAAETADYIEHRMKASGHTSQRTFPPEVLVEIYRRTGGVPRLINAFMWMPTGDQPRVACRDGEHRHGRSRSGHPHAQWVR